MKKTACLLSTISLVSALSAFEWPVSGMVPEKIKTFFGQKRSSTISSSLMIESSPEKGQEEGFVPEVRVSEDGKILMIISDIEDDNDFFPSTLGQAVIITHGDNITTVYGNLDNTDSFKEFDGAPHIKTGALLGKCGNTGWKEKSQNPVMEVSIIDSKKGVAINPRILFPRLEKEKSFVAQDIVFENKDGKRYDLTTNKSFASGTYKFYQKRNESISPLKVSISVNGELTDEIDFSSITQSNNDLIINGKNRKYSHSEIYPDDKLMLCGECKMSKGKSVITFENTNTLGEKRTVNYSVTVW